jgi:hypothetical protein
MGVKVNIRKLAGAVAATAVAVSIAAATAAPASATDNIKPFGDQARVKDYTGAWLIGYTVTDFGPSSDAVGHNGQLFAATLTVQTYGSEMNPQIARFGARAENGDFYPVLANAPGGFGGGPIGPDGRVTGRLYFDVVGAQPNSVVYNDGIRDIIAWVPGESRGGTQA